MSGCNKIIRHNISLKGLNIKCFLLPFKDSGGRGGWRLPQMEEMIFLSSHWYFPPHHDDHSYDQIWPALTGSEQYFKIKSDQQLSSRQVTPLSKSLWGHHLGSTWNRVCVVEVEQRMTSVLINDGWFPVFTSPSQVKKRLRRFTGSATTAI